MAEGKQRLAAVRGYREGKFNWPEPVRSKTLRAFIDAWPIGTVFDTGLWEQVSEARAGFDWSYLTEEEEAAYRLTGKI